MTKKSQKPKTVAEYLKAHPESTVARAHAFAKKAHKGQKRASGKSYFRHPEAVAQILLEWGLDEATIAAGLLHDTVEDNDEITSEHIKKEFGEEIAFLVDGVTKLSKIRYKGTEAQVDNLRKMMIALSEDLRVIFIKLADRLHNMRTLDALSPKKQKRIALETDDIYAPLAYRLGMQNVSGELHELAFPHLNPDEYKWLSNLVEEKYDKRRAYLTKLKPKVKKALAKHSITPQSIDFRAKRLSSLYGKLKRRDMDFEKIYDLIAMRIIVGSVEECYGALGAIHEHWSPLPGLIKDYIAMPKPNGYRSLHTTVIGPNDRVVEFQIRTQDMHEEAEQGIAAHWLYKSKNGYKPQNIKRELRWVNQLREWQEKYRSAKDSEDFLESMKVDFFRDRIFTITPQGEVVDLPAGATPVDFAYHIHTEIGNGCAGAKVNGKIVPLDYELESGDMVEVTTQKNKKPSEDWLEFVKSPSARDHIKTALKKKTNTLVDRAPTKARLEIVAKDRIGLLKDVAGIISRSHINIVDASVRTQEKGGFSVYKIICETAERQKIEKLIVKIKKEIGAEEINYKFLR